MQQRHIITHALSSAQLFIPSSQQEGRTCAVTRQGHTRESVAPRIPVREPLRPERRQKEAHKSIYFFINKKAIDKTRIKAKVDLLLVITKISKKDSDGAHISFRSGGASLVGCGGRANSKAREKSLLVVQQQ
mmetsp:Transcript_21632/g.45160  ORF Transcript_21632/g.45160 Transcript_21632/m.45160 type:complete len:132 (-) Transcript_21632:3795-4190(-)